MDLNGTDADEDLIGTTESDRIYGFGGYDRLYAKGGNDELYGGAGNDLLDGMGGADTMFGGSGNDTYRVDDAGDVVSEETVAGVDDGGIDLVQSSISYTLGRFVENLTLTDTGAIAINGTGNELANKIIGNAAANILSGGGGNDTINGGAGDDRLIGGAGKDTLTGGTGSDTFVFGPADASTDKVVDFTAEDWVGILASDYGLSAGKGLVNDGTGKLVLDAAYFGTVSSSTSVQATVSGHGQFVYNTTTRALMWDADGAGTASSGIALAVFNSGVGLRAGNFAITTGTVNEAPTAVALTSTLNQASTAVALPSTVNQASTAVALPSTVNQASTAVALSNNVISIIPLILLALCIAYLLIAPRRLAQGEQRQRRCRPYSVILPFRRK